MPCFPTTIPLKRCLLSIFLVLLCFNSFSHARDQRKTSVDVVDVHVSSLLPQEEVSCSRHSSRGKVKGVASLEVVHRHGPCSSLKSAAKSKNGTLTDHSHLLTLDQERVDSIHARLSGQSNKVGKHSNSVNLPAQSGASIGSGNYIVSVGLGTPQKQLSLIFDTGSDLTWTQCKPCMKSCYSQAEAIFDPTSSSSYTNITCSSALCANLVSATGTSPGCSSSTCIYGIAYGDHSFSAGFFAEERLTLTSADYIDGFVFGCGENNQGLFSGSAGLIGLGRDQLSLVSQAAGKYGKYFSYCLPPSSTSTGHLTLGQGGTSATTFSYTPFVTRPRGASFYFVDLQSINVGGRRLPISPTVFSAAGTIVDSGTVISRLPPQAYSALSSAFKQYMSKYPSAPAYSLLDTCFDFSNYQTVSIPKITLNFGGGGALDVPLAGLLTGPSVSQLCLAFTGNSGSTDTGIVGNVQQKGLDVVYDVGGGRIGFGSGGC